MRKHFYTTALTLIAFIPAIAQAPGGVSTNLSLWVKGNSGITTTGSFVDGWTYANDGTKSFSSTGANRPTLTPNSINFNPALTFAGAQVLVGPNGIDAPIAAGDDDYSIFGVWRSTLIGDFPSPERIWSQRGSGAGADGASIFLYNSTSNPLPQAPLYGDQPEIAPFTQGATRPFTIGTWYASQLNILNTGANDLEIIDQFNLGGTPLLASTDGANGAATRNLSNLNNLIGARNNGGFFDENLFGDVAEIIVFTRPISGAERNQIFSYLSLKYGIHAGTDLIASDGSTIWDATTNATYNNAVFGIGRDDASDLLHTISNSIVTGSGDGTGILGEANLTISNPSSLTSDLNFLIVGHDGGLLTESNVNVPAAATSSLRLGRQWKVQHTGNVGTTTLAFDLNGITITGTLAGHFRLMVDEDGDGDFTTGTVRFYPADTYTGDVLTFNGITLNDDEVFALISAGSSTLLPVTFMEFKAREKDGQFLLDWKVENNEDGKNYEILHSIDGSDFRVIGTVDNIVDKKQYSFIYKSSLGGKHYFRIRQTDWNGEQALSNILVINRNSANLLAVQVMPNPVRGNGLNLEFQSLEALPVAIELWSASGTLVSSQSTSLPKGVSRLTVNFKNASAGNYIVKIITANDVITKKIVKL